MPCLDQRQILTTILDELQHCIECKEVRIDTYEKNCRITWI